MNCPFKHEEEKLDRSGLRGRKGSAARDEEAKKKRHACIEYSAALYSHTGVLTYSVTDEGESNRL